MNKNKLAKLWTIFAKFAKVSTDKGELIIDGEIAEGTNVMIEDESSEDGTKMAEDGDYVLDDERIIKIADGKIAEIVEKEEEKEEAPEVEIEELKEEEEEKEEKEEEKEEETKEDEKPEDEAPETEAPTDNQETNPEVEALQNELAGLKEILSQKDDEIAALQATIEEMKKTEESPVEAPVSLSKSGKYTEEDLKANPALKYFND